ncbi:carbohydrate kinase [Puteibacter caeruleilacunae]|nr:carbohydrate kinase [Puteibacter caeruleilacunae]
MEQPVIIGIGELLWDILPDGKQMGGAPANFAFHASQMGVCSAVVSAIGDDVLGDKLIASIESLKLNYKISRLPYPTGVVNVSIAAGGIPEYEIVEGVAWDYMPVVEDGDWRAKLQAVCFGSLAQRNEVSRNTIQSFIKSLSDEVLKVFDVNVRQHFYDKELIHDSLSVSNIFKLNDDELQLMCKLWGFSGSNEKVCTHLLEKYDLELVVLTCGEKGSYLISRNEISFQDTPDINVVDTVGAGDSFTAAVVVGLLEGKDMVSIHKHAVELAAYVCKHAGAVPDHTNLNSHHS